MSLSKLFFASSLVAASQAITKDVKFGIFSDLHINLNYNPDSSDNYCTSTNQTDNQAIQKKIPLSELKLDKKALLGRLGCDAPLVLLEYILMLFNQLTYDEKGQGGYTCDYILINGDLIAHGLSQDPKGPYRDDLYQQLKDTHVQVNNLFKEYFWEFPVFITFGNNDSKYHNNAPFKEDKEDFYGFLFDIWFKNFNLANPQWADRIHDNFMDGGYYKIDLNNKLTLLSLNTLYFNKYQDVSQIDNEVENQFQWLENNLQDTSRKFIIMNHIYAGARVQQNPNSQMEELWREDVRDRYFNLLLKYKNQLVIELAGHDHWEDLRYYEDQAGNSYRNLFVAAGVGLDHNQLPGYSTLKIDQFTQTPYDLEMTVMDITYAYGLNEYPQLISVPNRTISFKNDFGFKNQSVSAIKQKMNDFKNGEITPVLNYLSDKIGFDPKDPDQFKQGEEISASWSLINAAYTKDDNFICQSSKSKTAQEIQDCVNDLYASRSAVQYKNEHENQSNAIKFIQ